jgi:transcriptional regulator with XRE-family HTH domain
MVCPVTAAALSAGLAAVVRARLSAGCRLTGLARRAGLSQSLVSNWLAGRRSLSLDSLDLLRCALGVGWCELGGCADSCPVRRLSASVVSIAAAARALRTLRARLDAINRRIRAAELAAATAVEAERLRAFAVDVQLLAAQRRDAALASAQRARRKAIGAGEPSAGHASAASGRMGTALDTALGCGRRGA